MTEVHRPGTGAIFGIVTEDSVVKSGSPVYLYDARRWAGIAQKRLLGVQLTRPDGGFAFAGLNPAYKDYMVLASDEDGVEPKNALVQDRVQPIPAHTGSGAFAEWYVRAMRDGAQAGFLAWPVHQDGLGEPVPRGLFGRPTRNEAHPFFWPPNPDAPPELPNMASLQFNPNGWGPFCVGQMLDSSDTAASLEVIVDLDTIAQQDGDCIIGGFHACGRTFSDFTMLAVTFYGLSSSSLGSGGMLGVAKLFLRLSPNKTVSARLTPYTAGRNWDHAETTLGSADLSAYSGMVHLVVSFTPSSDVKFFVDGALVHTAVTASAGTTETLQAGDGRAVFGVTDRRDATSRTLNLHERDYLLSLGVYYNQALTAQQAEDHYKALYNNNLISPVSGYAREVFIDTPHMYWRMDDFDVENRLSFASDVNWRDPSTGVGYWATRLGLQGSELLVDPIVQSPIAGRNTVGVTHGNSNFFRANHGGTYGWLFRDRGSFSCWAKFDLETPTVTEFVAEFHLFDSSSPYFDVYRITAGQLRVRLWEGGSTNTYTFDYTPPHGVWQYIAITIDKTGEIDGELRLYVGDEQNQPTLQQTILIPLSSLYTVAAISTDAPVGNNPSRVQTMRDLTGSVCELAAFPETLTPERIEAHWQAKDTV